MEYLTLPASQRELLITARGGKTQAEFAKVLQVDRSCLSRYEHEKLGAPTSVLNHCLRTVAERAISQLPVTTDIQRALALTKRAVDTLERAATIEKSPPIHKR